MRRRVTRTVAVLGLLVAVAVAVRIVAGAVSDGLDAADEVVVSSRSVDLVEVEDDEDDDDNIEGDRDGDGGTEDGDEQPLRNDGSETPEQATLVARTVASKGEEDDDEDSNGDGDGNEGDGGGTAPPTDNDGIEAPAQVDNDAFDTPTPSPLTPSPLTASPLTPSPITPTPLTPTPLTPSPITPSPLTPSPLTPSPLTPSPLTPSPLTPSPLTPSPLSPETPPSSVSDVSTVSNNDDPDADGVATHQLARTAGPSARAKRLRRAPLRQPSLLGAVEFPDDAALPDLGRLFDPAWVWDASGDRFADTPLDPCRLRIRHFSHLPGRAATANYEVQWPDEAYLASEFLTVSLRRGRAAAVSRFPDDAALPGLAPAMNPDSALRLVDRHVFRVPRRRMAVETVRYRPANRAVLRHQAGKFRFFARIVRPTAVPNLLAAAELIDASGFVSTPVVGCWADGGVVWVPEVPGVNLRDALSNGHTPDPQPLLDGLASLWDIPLTRTSAPPFDLAGAYRRAERTFAHVLRDDTEGQHLLREFTDAVGGFVDTWQPTATAHNDFYDDQMIVMPDGRVALVDFEEAGPGDPMLDVGNLLAHLTWTIHNSRHDPAGTRDAFYEQTKHAALDRFGWDPHHLALREAVCIFRICTNTVRRIQPDWQQQTRAGLALALHTLAGKREL